MWRRKKATWYFLPLKMMCKFCSTILFLSFRQEMDLLDPLIWSYGGNLRLPLTHFKIKSEPSASKGLSNSVFICKNYRSEQKDVSLLGEMLLLCAARWHNRFFISYCWPKLFVWSAILLNTTLQPIISQKSKVLPHFTLPQCVCGGGLG